MPDEKPTYVPTRQVRRRYGDRSEMWIERRLRDNSGFPQPVKLGARRYWRLAELEAWERACAAAAEAGGA
jgi:predicted DNA-binding transcriptional regulator AlpA